MTAPRSVVVATVAVVAVITAGVAMWALRSPSPSEPTLRGDKPGIVHRGTTFGADRDHGSLTIAIPRNVAPGDILLARIATDAREAARPPAGWRKVSEAHHGAAVSAWIFRRLVSGSEPTRHTFRVAGRASGTISAFSGVDTSRPVDASAASSHGATSDLVGPPLTTTSGNDVVVWFGSQVDDGSACPYQALTEPPGFTEVFNTCSTSTSGGVAMNVARRQVGAAAVQPTWNGTSVITDSNIVQVVALRPKAAIQAATRYADESVDVAAIDVPDTELHEPSGLAASRTNPHVFYVMSEADSGTFLAVNALTGKVVGAYALKVAPGVLFDTEDVAVGPCPQGSCLYVGDIGRARAGATPPNTYDVLRIAEPDIASGQTVGSFVPERFRWRYPSAKQFDSEALLVHPKTGAIYVVTKAADGRSGVYRFPGKLPPPSDATVTTLARVATLHLPRWTHGPKPKDSDYAKVTAGAIHPLGDRLLLRTMFAVWELRSDGGFETAFAAQPRLLTVPAGESQGESIEYAPDGSAYYTIGERPRPPYTLKRIDRS